MAGVLFTVAQIVVYLQFPMGPLWLAVLDEVVQVASIVAPGVSVRRGGGHGTDGRSRIGPEGLRVTSMYRRDYLRAAGLLTCCSIDCTMPGR